MPKVGEFGTHRQRCLASRSLVTSAQWQTLVENRLRHHRSTGALGSGMDGFRLGPSGDEPIWRSEPVVRETHGDPDVPFDPPNPYVASSSSNFGTPNVDFKTLLFQAFSSYHQLPESPTFVNDPIFLRAIHLLQTIDHTDFRLLPVNPKPVAVDSTRYSEQAISLAGNRVPSQRLSIDVFRRKRPSIRRNSATGSGFPRHGGSQHQLTGDD